MLIKLLFIEWILIEDLAGVNVLSFFPKSIFIILLFALLILILDCSLFENFLTLFKWLLLFIGLTLLLLLLSLFFSLISILFLTFFLFLLFPLLDIIFFESCIFI